ncbi:MFS transporter [Brevibacillus borstelensis]|uniref:MFS transporter n=1 Tax=Brevibacillus borstelensis TaxID=45462 RepID=UPI00203BE792|nr:MFS transporter [Brevibacillus borstelensis]MCM3471482.1 MFS transporter [Brevibacillus borstelensis]MCM3624253.1 MFS transporter [Brevibacillus borstelensis]
MTMTATPSPNPVLWRNSQFLRLWIGNLISALADGAFFIALSWFIVDKTGSEAVLGTTLMCMSIPRLLFMLVGGVAADKYNRKWIMFGSILARGVVLGAFGLLLLQKTGHWLPYAAYLTAFLFGTVDAFFWPARSSVLPFVVSREQLAPANSLMEIAQQISLVGGPLTAALLMRLTSYPATFLVMAAAFFIGTLIISTLRLQPAEEIDTSRQTKEPSFFRQIFEGILFAKTIPVLMIIFGTSLVVNMMFSGPVNMGLPLLVKQLGWDSNAYSSLSTSLGVGTIIGGVITGACNGFRGRFLLLPFFLGLMGAGILAVSFMHVLPFGLSMMLLVGITMAMTNIPLITYIQTIVPAHMLGRVMSLLTTMSIGLGPVSYALCSFLLETKMLEAGTLLLVGGIAVGLLGMSLILFRHFREAEQHPLWAQQGAKKQQEQEKPQTTLSV